MWCAVIVCFIKYIVNIKSYIYFINRTGIKISQKYYQMSNIYSVVYSTVQYNTLTLTAPWNFFIVTYFNRSKQVYQY